MTLVLILGVIALVIFTPACWALTQSAAIRSRHAGRRDQLAGRVDTNRCRTDSNYLDGAASEYLRGAR